MCSNQYINTKFTYLMLVFDSFQKNKLEYISKYLIIFTVNVGLKLNLVNNQNHSGTLALLVNMYILIAVCSGLQLLSIVTEQDKR